MKNSPPATLKTVAEACGLAVTTVSRALNGHTDIAISTRKKVQDKANEIGYVPNRQGQALRTGQTHMVSLVVPSHAAISGYTSSIIFSMGAVLRDKGYELSALPAYPDQDELGLIRSIVENRRADGIILTSIKPQDIRVRYLLEKGIPFVTHGRTELASAHAYVDFDNERFAEWAAARLIQKGRRRLMLIGPAEELTYANHMNLGYRRAVNQALVDTVSAPRDLYLESSLDVLREEFRKIVLSAKRPDGIICGGELAALAVTAAIRDAGLEPEKDISIVAKQTSSALDHTHPPIDTCHEDINATGSLLAEALIALIRQEKTATELTTVIKPDIRWRTEPTETQPVQNIQLARRSNE
ncbi:MAG: LacI family transcriptional regulator [Gammaproteobacteria bacterium]|nr:LacI family transcriptional regulator [Gammaproteobacteria bacterium]